MRSGSPTPFPFLHSHAYETYSTQSTWFLRATAISASWLALAGYTLFSLLVSPSDQLRWPTDVLAALGGIALTSGYLGGLIAFYFARTLPFRLDSVILPLLLSSVGGLFAIIINWALHKEIQTGKAYVYAPLAVACVSTVICSAAALCLNTQRKIHMAVEESRRRHLELTTPATETLPPHSSWGADVSTATAGTPFLDHSATSYTPHQSYHRTSYDSRHQTPLYPNGNSPALTPKQHSFTTTHAPPRPYTLQNMPMPPPLRHMSSTELRPIEMNIPEDEAQRRQLLRLLIAKEQAGGNEDESDDLATGRGRDRASKDGGTHDTYRIDWPGSALLDEQGMLSPPLLRKTEVQQTFPPPPTGEESGKKAWAKRFSAGTGVGKGERDDGEGEISNRWSIGNLLGRKKAGEEVAVGESRGTSGNEEEEARLAREESLVRQREERERRRREIERGGLDEGRASPG